MRTLQAGPRRIVVRASVDTLLLVVAASAATFMLAHSIHARQEPIQVASAAPIEAQKDWTGHLADVAAGSSTPTVEPLSSASLVVPKAQLALPAAAVTIVALPKARACDGAPCPKVAALAPTPVPRQVAGYESNAERTVHKDRSLLSRLNPLNHIPDMSTIGRPFAYAGDAISGWVSRF